MIERWAIGGGDQAWPRRAAALRLHLPTGSNVQHSGDSVNPTAEGWFELPWATSLTLIGMLVGDGA